MYNGNTQPTHNDYLLDNNSRIGNATGILGWIAGDSLTGGDRADSANAQIEAQKQAINNDLAKTQADYAAQVEIEKARLQAQVQSDAIKAQNRAQNMPYIVAGIVAVVVLAGGVWALIKFGK
jgi:predicted outer membrane protein